MMLFFIIGIQKALKSLVFITHISLLVLKIEDLIRELSIINSGGDKGFGFGMQ